MPATAAAFARGELSTDKVDELCQANAKKRRARSAEAEERLVADAKRLGFADLQNVLAMRRNAADAEAANDSAQRHQPGQRPPPLRPHDRHRPGRSTPATSPPDLADEPDDEWNDPPVDTIDTGGPVETTEPVDVDPHRNPVPDLGPRRARAPRTPDEAAPSGPSARPSTGLTSCEVSSGGVRLPSIDQAMAPASRRAAIRSSS